MSAAFNINQGELWLNGERLLRDATFHLPVRGVCVLLGPSGTGKSKLLSALAGGASLERRGLWRLPKACGLLPQLRASAKRTTGSLPTTDAELDAAMTLDVPLLLLDEPERRLCEAARGELPARIRARAEQRCVVVTTHDLSFARSIADHVLFLCAGMLQYSGPARRFFEDPPSDLAKRFVTQGNCWPTEPDLPAHFRWILPDRIAGMGRPGMLRDAQLDLHALSQVGMTLLVSLTEAPYPIAELRNFGLAPRHFPIHDMGVPSLGPTASLCGYLERIIEQDGKVAVHCQAGLGRTGLILASFLVWLGDAPERAIETVRSVRLQYIQNKAQLEFVHRFGDHVGVKSGGRRREVGRGNGV